MGGGGEGFLWPIMTVRVESEIFVGVCGFTVNISVNI